MKQGNIIVVPFPYADKLAEKRRPALVISSENFTDETSLVWVAMITTTKSEIWHGDVEIPQNRNSGLMAASTIRLAKLATIEFHRVVKVVGKIDAATAKTVKQFFSTTVC